MWAALIAAAAQASQAPPTAPAAPIATNITDGAFTVNSGAGSGSSLPWYAWAAIAVGALVFLKMK